MWIQAILASVILVPLAILYRPVFVEWFTPRGIPGIPAFPHSTPLLGDIPLITKNMKAENSFSYTLDKAARELGALCQLRLGFKSMLIVSDYQTIETLLVKHHQSLDRDSQTIKLFGTILPHGQIALPTADKWKHHRRIIGPAMTSKYLSLTTPKANESIGELVKLWKVKTEKAGGRPWAAPFDIENATMDVICNMAFGTSWGCLSSSMEQITSETTASAGAFGEAVFRTKRPDLAVSTWHILDSLPRRSLIPTWSHFLHRLGPTWRRHHSLVYGYLADKLDESRMRAKAIGPDAAAELADNTMDMMVSRELRGEDWMPDVEMKQEVFQYLVAGTETSSSTLSWWLKYMTNHPQVQRKLRSHVLHRLPELQDRCPTFEEMNAKAVPYLEAVVHETLRLSRTAGGYGRDTIEDIVIMGKRVPKGTAIVFPTVIGYEDSANPVYGDSSFIASKGSSATDEDDEVAIRLNESFSSVRDHNDRKVGFWAAHTGIKFDPERWLDDEGHFNPNAGPSLPFSLGQRSCFGKNLALLELRLFICQLSQAFFFAPLPDEQNSQDKYETIATHPVQCLIRPLSWDSAEAQA